MGLSLDTALKRIFSPNILTDRYTWTRIFITRGMAFVYLIAFSSLSLQILGLAGKDGIMPIKSFLRSAKSNLGANYFEHLPSLFWFNDTDNFILAICYAGIVISILAFLGILQGPCFALLWFFYLSFFNTVHPFLGFQWDTLLLESGFITIFFAPWRFFSGLKNLEPPSRILLFLFHWLSFRLMFSSGVVKLLSGDPSWTDMSALTYHYETQPLPNNISWYMHNLPLWFHQISAIGMFIVELIIPFFVFFSRYLKRFAALCFIGLMMSIGMTGNYGFFNILSIVIFFSLIDDEIFSSLIPKFIKKRMSELTVESVWQTGRLFISILIFILVFSLSTAKSQNQLSKSIDYPPWAIHFIGRMGPWHITSTYGLFAVMTKTRPEIEIEGSDDGQTWKPYTFPWKIGDIHSDQQILVGHMPRADWQMWFAAMSDINRQTWFKNLLIRLLQGKKVVTDLFVHNPFPDHPPVYVRAHLFNYRYTTTDEIDITPNHWSREYIKLYSPPFRLEPK